MKEEMGRAGRKTEWTPVHEFFPEVNHYYGDLVRQFMIAGVALMLVAAPFYSDSLRAQFPYEIFAAVLMAAFAALTNPFKRSIVLADALLAGSCVIVFGAWAFTGYDPENPIAFMVRDAIALVFLCAFYFSLKTVRAMIMHQIGKPDSPVEFRRTMSPRSAQELIEEEMTGEPGADPLAREKEAVERFMRHERAG